MEWGWVGWWDGRGGGGEVERVGWGRVLAWWGPVVLKRLMTAWWRCRW